MYHIKFSGLVRWLLFMMLANALFAQESGSFTENAKLIRIKKIATEWQGSLLTLHTGDEVEISGRLIGVANGYYHLETPAGEIQIALTDVVMVSFKPGMPEILLGFASAAMGSAFLSGALLISNEDASTGDLSLAAFLGLLGGGLWGYSTFYETEVFELE